MKKIQAFRCEYCTKIYENRGSASSHERKCFFNPSTHSCASCALFELRKVEFSLGHFFEIQVCLVNEDVSNKNLRTKCPLYRQAEFDPEFGFKINTPPHEFDPELALKRVADKIEWMKKQTVLDEIEMEKMRESMGTA